jgi:hypothetical protein
MVHLRICSKHARLSFGPSRLVSCFISTKSGDPVRAWIAANADKISEIAPITASISPEEAVAVTRKGGRLNLAGHNSADRRLQADAFVACGCSGE